MSSKYDTTAALRDRAWDQAAKLRLEGREIQARVAQAKGDRLDRELADMDIPYHVPSPESRYEPKISPAAYDTNDPDPRPWVKRPDHFLRPYEE